MKQAKRHYELFYHEGAQLIRLILCVLVFTFLGLLTACTQNADKSDQSEKSPTEPIDTPAPTESVSLPCVLFSMPSGFYESPFELTLTCNVPDATIYYTTDGTIPDAGDTRYEEPITLRGKTPSRNILSARKDVSAGNTYVPKDNVKKAHIIRAVAFLPDGSMTPVTYGTYFIGISQEKEYGTTPVISLITEPENLFDFETGIYVLGKTHEDWLAEDPSRANLPGWQHIANFSNSGKEWERPVSVEYISADGVSEFQIDMGLRIMGAASRNSLQKSLKLIAREEYGAKSLKYELIPGNLRSDGTGLLTKYKSFVLRNGGNDCDYAKFRDPLLQQLVSHRRFETLQSTPCVVFLNGEYWGAYSLTEDYSDNYIENNYGIDKDNVVIVKCGAIEDGKDEDIELYYEMYDFITGNDMSIEENYAKACSLLDMGSFLDYCVFELYVYNQDSMFENNNWRMWRVRTPDKSEDLCDGLWRMMVYDTDFSTGIYDGGNNYNTDNITDKITAVSAAARKELLSYRAPIELFRSLYQNPRFRNELILTLCDMRNADFNPSTVKDTMDEMAAVYETLVPDTLMRFGPEWALYQENGKQYYADKISELRTFLNGRYNAMPGIMKRAFGLGIMTKLTLTTPDASLGTVQINHTLLDLSESFSGLYFEDSTITLTAVPADGCRFVGWEDPSGILSDTTSQTVSIQLTHSYAIKALFEKK
ncbi:MAG: CotH kinase family protein [Lachnospiraceae bacterium]